jgi:hypothetical protein
MSSTSPDWGQSRRGRASLLELPQIAEDRGNPIALEEMADLLAEMGVRAMVLTT